MTRKANGLKVEDRQKVKGKRRKFKKPLFTFAFLLLWGACSGSSLIGYQAYTANYPKYMTLARGGLQHLRTAATLLETLPKNPFDSHQVTSAQHEFATALTAFDGVDNGLRSFAWISGFFPIYGSRLSAALNLVSVAMGVSQAGVAGCNILNVLIARFHDPLSTQGHGLTMADMNNIDQDFHSVKLALNSAIDAAYQIQPGDLQFDPSIGKMFVAYYKELPALQAWLENVDMLLKVVPALLGIDKPSNYLLELLDSSELRPGGGFIGNYGFVTLSGGKLAEASITDVDLLDGYFRKTIGTVPGVRFPYPPAYSWFSNYLARDSWSLRDSNLDPDFPINAKYGELNYLREGGKFPGDGPVQGVIAITPTFIEHALEITGPIVVPEYHETVTSQNLVSRIHYYQLGGGGTFVGEGDGFRPSPDGHSSLRKRFTALLALHFLAHVRKLSSSAFSKFFQLLISSLHSKDIQIYFNSSVAESMLHAFHLDGAIQVPIDDGLFVVDTNMAGNKANGYIISKLDDQVYIDTRGDAVHHTTISYAWVIPGQIYVSAYGPHYRDYVRVYTPFGSILQMEKGWQRYDTGPAFLQRVWGGYFTLDYGQTNTINLIWMVPFAAKQDKTGWYYRYLVQRQAGSDWVLHLQMNLPSCATVTNTWGGLVATSRRTVMLTQTLDEDKNLGVNYSC